MAFRAWAPFRTAPVRVQPIFPRRSIGHSRRALQRFHASDAILMRPPSILAPPTAGTRPPLLTTAAIRYDPVMRKPRNLKELKAAIERGDYRDQHVSVLVDNDCVPVSVGPKTGEEEHEALMDLGTPEEALMEALRLLGIFDEVDHV
jgi:hypothetical protein